MYNFTDVILHTVCTPCLNCAANLLRDIASLLCIVFLDIIDEITNTMNTFIVIISFIKYYLLSRYLVPRKMSNPKILLMQRMHQYKIWFVVKLSSKYFIDESSEFVACFYHVLNTLLNDVIEIHFYELLVIPNQHSTYLHS